jgi:hypothetical protein
LRDGTQLTRTELRAVLERQKVGPVSGQRLGHLMMQAELDAVICSGGRRGKQFTYALLDERAPATPPRDRDDALLELTRRYFTTRGPASVHDFAWWSGLTMADARRGIGIAGKELEQVVHKEKTLWMRPRSMPAPKAGPTTHLLPNYDEYFIGFKDRSSLADRIREVTLVTGGDGLIAHVVVIDGLLVGGWRREVAGKGNVVRLKLIAPLSAAERRRVNAAGERFARFLGEPVSCAT